MLKKGFAVILLIITLFAITSHGYASSNLTLEQKAEALGKLSLLKGDNGDYKLNDTMQRMQAATIVVRLLGKEQFVIDNRETFKLTKFPDVPVDSWYAAYVGYCAQEGIISGDDKGRFNPEGDISEKAFLKLVLGVLEYKIDIDYKWDNVYKKAYEIGLVTDSNYMNKVDDNYKYTRGDMVNVIYNAISLNCKVSKESIIQKLVDSNIISKELLISAGFINDSLEASIESINSLSSYKVKITFNERLQEFTEKNVEIYETDDINKKLDVIVESFNGNEILLKTSYQMPDKVYSVIIRDIKDTEGFLSNTILVSFKGFKQEDVKSDFFRISRIEVNGSNSINICYTQPVNQNAELIDSYDLYENGILVCSGKNNQMTAKLNGIDKNVVTLYFNSLNITEGKEYSIYVNGNLVSLYGVKLNEGAGDNKDFSGIKVSSQGLSVDKIIGINDKTLLVYFNMPIDKTTATKNYFYSISDKSNPPITINKVELSDVDSLSNNVIKISLDKSITIGSQYNLTVNYMLDSSKQYNIMEQSYPFTIALADKKDLNIELAQAMDRETIIVYLNKPLNPTMAEKTTFYQIIGITHSGYFTQPVKVSYDYINDPLYLKLYIPKDKALLGNEKYTLRIASTMPDVYNNVSSKNTEYTFEGVNFEKQMPYIAEALIIGDDTIKISFSDDVAPEAPNVLVSSYMLEIGSGESTTMIIPIATSYIDSKTLILRFSDLDMNEKYILKYKPLKDMTGAQPDSNQSDIKSIEVKLGNR